jgi:hypothetical protein
MKKNKKIAFVSLLFILCITSLNAQEYKTAIGLRGGFYNGLSLKHFVSTTNAVEGIIATHHRGLLLAGMYQIHANAFDAPGLYWYYGGGAHLGFYNRQYTPRWYNHQTGNFSTFGIMGVLGMEYKIQEIPVTVGLDITPAFDIIGHTGLWLNSGITLRYTFK